MKKKQVSILNIALMLSTILLGYSYLSVTGRVGEAYFEQRRRKLREQAVYLKHNYSQDSALLVELLQELKKIYRHYPPVILRFEGKLFVWAPDEFWVANEDGNIEYFNRWATDRDMSQVQIIYPNADPDLLWDGI